MAVGITMNGGASTSQAPVKANAKLRQNGANGIRPRASSSGAMLG